MDFCGVDVFFGEEYGMARLPYAGSRAVRYLHLGD